MKKWHLLLAIAAISMLAPASAMAQFSSQVCGGNSPAFALDPSFPYDFADNAKECVKLCGIQAKVCAKIAANQAECDMEGFKAFTQGLKIDCNDSESPGECRSDVANSRKLVLGSMKTELGDEKLDCKDYLEQCANGCVKN